MLAAKAAADAAAKKAKAAEAAAKKKAEQERKAAQQREQQQRQQQQQQQQGAGTGAGADVVFALGAAVPEVEGMSVKELKDFLKQVRRVHSFAWLGLARLHVQWLGLCPVALATGRVSRGAERLPQAGEARACVARCL
jgi:hypothetical protein